MMRVMRKYLGLGLGLICLAPAAHSDGFTQHSAHVHGVATLLIAIEQDGEMNLIFDSPGMNLVGFESAHLSAEQQQLVDATLRALEDPANIITLPAAAACSLTQASARISGQHDDHNHSHDHSHEHDHGDSHAHMDFLATLTLRCEQPGALQSVALPVFAQWPGIERVNVAWVLESGQGATTATAAQATVRLR